MFEHDGTLNVFGEMMKATFKPPTKKGFLSIKAYLDGVEQAYPYEVTEV